MRLYDLTGKRYGSLTVIELAYKTKDNRNCWLCKCDCGNETIVRSDNLINGHTKSCGCLREKTSRKLLTTHGLSETRIYKIYKGMKERTTNKNIADYKYYGDRGIKVCKEWENDFMLFYNWAINNGYKNGLSIDRIDVNGDYEPSNCRWATAKQQQNNRTFNHNITYKGETHTISEWSEKIGINRNTLYSRINTLHWSIERALTQKV